MPTIQEKLKEAINYIDELEELNSKLVSENFDLKAENKSLEIIKNRVKEFLAKKGVNINDEVEIDIGMTNYLK